MYYQRNNSFRGRSSGNRGGGFNRSRFGGRRQPRLLDPRFFVQKAVEDIVEEYTPKHSFEEFEILSQLKQNIISHGYKTPTPIQDQAIPHLLEGRDVIGIAGTGTGKTAAFLVPLIQKVVAEPGQKVLIVAPTRELALQIEEELRAFSRNMKVFSVLCIGGVGMYPQIRGLSRNPHFVIGTPGRLRDLERQRRLYFEDYKTIVLDEVDRMLDMGFIQEVSYIMSKLSSPRQTLFFSATLPDKVQRLMQGFVRNPITVSVRTTRPSTNVDQDVVKVGGQAKIDVLHELLIKPEFEKVLVFGRTKYGTERLLRDLVDRGFRAASIHGNKSQGQRQRAISDFKQNRVQVLLATDVASRGLDIDDVTHVINYDQPETYEDYIHRIGRTGRANKKGSALTFVD